MIIPKPIWADETVRGVNPDGAATGIYKLTDGSGNVIQYGGRMQDPSAQSYWQRIVVNRICEGYLNPDFHITENSSYTVTGAMKDFEIFNYRKSTDRYTSLGDYRYIWNYTYKDTVNNYDNDLILNTRRYDIDRRMYCPYSVYKVLDATETTAVIYIAHSAHPQDEYQLNGGINIIVPNRTHYPLATELETEEEYPYMIVDGYPIIIRDNYCDFALYFVNRRGGIDWICCNNINYKSETINRTNYQSNGSNNTGTINIQNNWTINTKLLPDEYDSGVIYENLFSSPKIWLHDLENDRLVEVNISDSSVQYKYFKGGKKIPQYTINVVEKINSQIR